jgi:hypothetical protein
MMMLLKDLSNTHLLYDFFILFLQNCNFNWIITIIIIIIIWKNDLGGGHKSWGQK